MRNEWGWKCPPCESSCEPDCCYTNRASFLEALRVYRDMEYDSLRAYSLCALTPRRLIFTSLAVGDERRLFLAQFYKDCQGAFTLFDRRIAERSGRIETGHRLIIDSMDYRTIRELLDSVYNSSVPVRIRMMIGERIRYLLQTGPEDGIQPSLLFSL